MSAAGSAGANPTAAAGTSASRPASTPAAEAEIFPESPQPRGRAVPRELRLPRAARATMAGRAKATSWSMPARSTCPSRPSWPRDRRRPAALGARARTGRARSAGAARALAAAARRGAGRSARLQPACVGRSATLEARPAPARAAAASAGDCRRPSAPDAARRFLAQPAHGLDDEEIASWSDEALAVTEAPAHAALFAESSRAEVPLIGTVRTPRGTFTVSGQVDRLAVVRARGADRRLQDQPAAARGGRAGGAGLPPPARALPGVAGRDLSGPHRPGFSPVDGCAVVDGNRRENPR